MTVMAPKNGRELEKMLEFAVMRQDRVQSVIREALHIRDWRIRKPDTLWQSEVLYREKDRILSVEA